MQGHCNMLLPFGRSWAFPNPPRLERIWGPGLIWEPRFLSGGTDLPLEWVWSLDINELICNCSCLKFRTKGGLGEPRALLFGNACCSPLWFHSCTCQGLHFCKVLLHLLLSAPLPLLQAGSHRVAVFLFFFHSQLTLLKRPTLSTPPTPDSCLFLLSFFCDSCVFPRTV